MPLQGILGILTLAPWYLPSFVSRMPKSLSLFQTTLESNHTKLRADFRTLKFWMKISVSSFRVGELSRGTKKQLCEGYGSTWIVFLVGNGSRSFNSRQAS